MSHLSLGKPCKAVLAEDDFLIRDMLREISEKYCEVIAEAENGRQAVDLTQQLHPDVVLLDISMPLLNGFEAAQIIHDKNPEVKIIIVSSYSDRSYINRAFQIGVLGYVFKSFATIDLPRALENILQDQTYCSI